MLGSRAELLAARWQCRRLVGRDLLELLWQAGSTHEGSWFLVLKGDKFHEEAGWELLSVLHLGRDWSSSLSAPPYKCLARLPGCSWACAGLSGGENLSQSGSAAPRVGGSAVLGRHAWLHSLSRRAGVWVAAPAWAHALQVCSGVLPAAGGLCRAVVAPARSGVVLAADHVEGACLRRWGSARWGPATCRMPARTEPGSHTVDCRIPARDGRHCWDKGAQRCLIEMRILAADWGKIPANRKRKRRAGPLARLIKPAGGWEQSREGLSCACPAMITPGCLHAMTSNITIFNITNWYWKCRDVSKLPCVQTPKSISYQKDICPQSQDLITKLQNLILLGG